MNLIWIHTNVDFNLKIIFSNHQELSTSFECKLYKECRLYFIYRKSLKGASMIRLSSDEFPPPILVLLATAEDCLFFLNISSISNVIAGVFHIEHMATFELRRPVSQKHTVSTNPFFLYCSLLK